MLNLKQFIKALSFEEWLLFFTGIVAVAISILDYLNWLNIGSDTLLQMTVVSLGLILISLVVQTTHQKHQFGSLENQLVKFVSNSLEIKRFIKTNYGVEYIAKRVDQCEDSMYQVSLSPPIPRWDRAASLFEQAVERQALLNQIKIRYIANFDDTARLERVKKLAGNPNINNYFASSFNLDKKSPLAMNFIIFDDNEIVLGVPGFNGKDTIISIKNSDIVHAFTQYFDLLWSSSIPFEKNQPQKNLSKK